MSVFARIVRGAASGFALANNTVRRFLLNRALQPFVKRPLTSDDQFELNVSEGLVTVHDIDLEPEVWWYPRLCLTLLTLFQFIREKLTGLPVSFESGSVERLTFSVPWRSLDTESVSVIVSGVDITVSVTPQGFFHRPCPFSLIFAHILLRLCVCSGRAVITSGVAAAATGFARAP